MNPDPQEQPAKKKRPITPNMMVMRMGGRMLRGLHDLCEWVRDEAGCAMGEMAELGSFAGESAVIFQRYFAVVHCVDAWERPRVEFAFDERVRGFLAGDVVKHKMLFAEAAGLFEDGSLDLIYIDGAHDYISVRRDAESWLPKLKPGGVCAGHDLSPRFPGVGRAVAELLPRHGASALRQFCDTSWAFTTRGGHRG